MPSIHLAGTPSILVYAQTAWCCQSTRNDNHANSTSTGSAVTAFIKVAHLSRNQIRAACIQTIDKIREHQGQKALTSTKTTTVVFGTSGWRGVIGEDFTMLNVHKTVRGIIDMMKTEDFLRYNKMSSFEDVKKAGILILRDNRYMGDEFMDAAMKVRLVVVGTCRHAIESASTHTSGVGFVAAVTVPRMHRSRCPKLHARNNELMDKGIM
jgi:hypothetical protein